MTLVTIEAGSDIAALNGGAGADYLFTEIDPAGETGGVVGAVFSLSLPLESLPIGTQHEIAVLTYQGALGVSTSTAAALDFTEELGDPDIEVVVGEADAWTALGTPHPLGPPLAPAGAAVDFQPWRW